jgi:integrase
MTSKKNLREIAFPPDNVLDLALAKARAVKAQRQTPPQTRDTACVEDGSRPAESTGDRRERGLYERYPGSNDWSIRYVDCNGKQRKEHVGPKSLAIKLLDKRRGEAVEGRKSLTKKASAPFDKLVDTAREHVKAHYTRPADELARLEVIRTWFVGRMADDITTADIRNALATAKRDRKWSDSSQNHHHSLVSLCYRIGLEANSVTASPIHGKIKKAEENNDRDRHLSDDEEKRLIEVLRSRPEWSEHLPEYILAVNTGLRRGDMYQRLKWENVDLIKREARIHKSKNGKPLSVPLNADALGALNVFRSRGDGTGRVVRNPDGVTLEVNQHWFQPAIKQAKILDFHWHDVRHTFASRLRQKGIPLEDIAALLGHSRKTGLAMTLRYAKQSQSNLAKAVAALETIRPVQGPATEVQNTQPRFVN